MTVTRPRIALSIQGEQMLACQDCGAMFFTIDPDRKYCDLHLVDRVNGAGILEDDDPDSLFTLTVNVCDRCGTTFETSRRNRLCAICAGPRATVQCPVCDISHEVPILAPHKLCLSCSADMEMTLASARVRLERAEEDAGSLSFLLDADVAHTDEATRVRFEAAVQMLITGQLAGRQLSTEQVKAAWERAKAKVDDLSPLLALYDRVAAAALAQQRASAAVQAVEEAIAL